MKLIVVDDEPLAVRGLCAHLAPHTDISVVATARNGREALQCIRAYAPDILLIDIEMPGLSGLDVLREMRAASEDPAPLVVFVTAHANHAAQAFEEVAFDYILKPVSRQRLEAVLDRCRAELAQRRNAAPAHSGTETARMTVRYDGADIALPVGRILALQAERDYVRVILPERSLLVRDTMDHLGAMLPEDRFLRVHRSWIVNLDRVEHSINGVAQGYESLTLADGTDVPIARARRQETRRRLLERQLESASS
jgi:DNA-binding LytR/AlgR family response regulator